MSYLKWFLIVIVILLLGGYWYAQPLLKVGAGYAAKMACSCHYLQGRSLDNIKAEDLNFSALKFIKLTHDQAKDEVAASFFGLITQRAKFIKGRGCVLIADENVPLPPEVPVPAMAGIVTPLPVYDTLPQGLNADALAQAVTNAFAPLPGGGTRGIVILHDGHLVHEKYAPGFTEATPLLGWSMTKSITNALVGIMVKNGKLTLQQDHLFSEWEDDERANITVENLLHMNSGLEWNEAYGGVSDATTMLYKQPDMAAYTRTKPLLFEPNTTWVYSSGTTNLLSDLVRQTLGNDPAYRSLVRDSLFLPIGMHSAQIDTDQSGTFVGSSYCWATARDWARFGQLYLQDGQWDGYPILPAGWVDFSRQVAAGSEGVYGAQVWLPDPEELSEVPEDLFMFRGFQDQRIVIIPSRKVVMVRLGMNEDKTFALNKFIHEVLAALPE
ncbi:serine hydrolase domain-containing protein [Lewinella sp. LCG006]|uniref:serine hydrolase domain-containing protein n=1 Tax=Lewinella sp. LCG006 TaxID=3231911 RepID=UPI00345FE84A